jgi:hypothetical protein
VNYFKTLYNSVFNRKIDPVTLKDNTFYIGGVLSNDDKYMISIDGSQSNGGIFISGNDWSTSAGVSVDSSSESPKAVEKIAMKLVAGHGIKK